MAEASTTEVLDPSAFTYVVGIDIGSETCCFTVLTPQKQVVVKPTDLANAASGFAYLQERIARLGVAPEQVVVGLEATSRYGENLFQVLQRQGYHLCLLHPRQTHEFARASGIAGENRSAGREYHCAGPAEPGKRAWGMCPMSRAPASASWCACTPNESR
jgi:transposase